MANPFPATYPTYEQYLEWFRQNQRPIAAQQPLQQTVQPNTGVINSNLVWVGSEKEAQDYMMAPNSVVFLRIPNSTDIYMKSTDNLGQPDFKKYAQAEIKPEEEKKEPEYLTINAFNSWVNENLTPTLEGLKQQKQAKRTNTRKAVKDEAESDGDV